jgi:hypothetical protein
VRDRPRFEIPPHPFPDDPLVSEHRPTLEDRLRDANESDALRALFGALPTRLLDALLAGGEADPPSLWILTLSGYFGGVWLRRELLAAQPDTPLAAMSAAPDEAACRAVFDAARAGAHASAQDAPELCRASLPGWLAGFGYNRGYLEVILENPPAGCTSPPNFLRVENPLWCEFRAHPLAALDRLWAVSQRTRLSDEQATALDAAHAAGRQVWSSGLSVLGLAQPAYAALLDLSARFLAATQAILLTALRAGEDDGASRAVPALRAGAGLAVWQGSYLVGLRDPSGDGRPASATLPRFVS